MLSLVLHWMGVQGRYGTLSEKVPVRMSPCCWTILILLGIVLLASTPFDADLNRGGDRGRLGFLDHVIILWPPLDSSNYFFPSSGLRVYLKLGPEYSRK